MNTIPNPRERELIRLRNIYPLFKFTMKENGWTNVQIDDHSSTSVTIDEYGRCGTTIHLDHNHLEKSIKCNLMKLYPDLYIGADALKDGIMISAYVKRNNHDAEAIDSLQIVDKNLHSKLTLWQKEAKKAKQENWFFCSGHQIAEPKSKWGFFHFTGNFCKEWGEQHHEQREEAARETYN